MPVAAAHREGFVLGMRSLPGNPSDGYTLHEALEQVEILADHGPGRVFVDRGYRGHAIAPVTGTAVFVSGPRRGTTRALRRAPRRRSAIGPTIGHMKPDGRLSRSPLKRTLGDALHAVPCGAGHNIRPILAHLRAPFTEILAVLLGLTGGATPVSTAPSRQITQPA